MNLATALIATPLLFGLATAAIPAYRIRRRVVAIGALAQALVALAFAASHAADMPYRLDFEAPWLDPAVLALELSLLAYILWRSIRDRRPLTLLLGLLQAGLALGGEGILGEARAGALLVVDQLSLVMVLLIGLVGGLIVYYATGYMQTWQDEHPEARDRRQGFVLTVFGFLGAMYGLVLADDLRLVLLFWEATTMASFFLIGYGEDGEARRAAYRAANLNLLGGISFAAGILLLARGTGSLSLAALARSGGAGAAAVLAPATLLAIAGLAKSAQLPFTPWLLGAMVAPTPVSALLHSSTMVKAGSYLLLRLSPALAGTTPGTLVAFIGILTFIVGAFAAVSARNAKRVLALSTVSNLGLIAACAGVGGYQLVWAALFLIMFHAVAKALLFLGVGTASVGTGSLDLEDMGGLAVSMPRIALLLVIGISAMFIAPFGMLVSKWAAMEAFITTRSLVSPLMIVMLAYGSATTVLFWTKWLGIVIRMPDPAAPRGLLEGHASRPELLAEGVLAAMTVALCAGFPAVSSLVVEPFIAAFFGHAFGLDRNVAVVTVLMVVMTVAVPTLLVLIARRSGRPLTGAYLSGRPQEPGLSVAGARGERLAVTTRSYYLEKYFGERRILPAGVALGALLAIVTLGTVFL